MTCRSTCVDYSIIMLNSFVAKTCISYTWYDVPFRQHLLTKCWPNFFHSKIWCLSFQTPYREMPYGFWIRNYIALKINHIFQFFFAFYNNQKYCKNSLKKVKNSNGSKIGCVYRTTSVDTAFESLNIEV